MKPGLTKASVPIVEGGQLASWTPWIYAGAAANKLSEPYFEGDDPFWPVNYAASISLLDTVRDCLRKRDRESFSEMMHVFDGFEAKLSREHPKNKPAGSVHYFWTFVHRERNDLLHQFKTQTESYEASTRPFLWDGDPKKVKSGTSLIFGGEEDPMRLIGIAHQNFEQALRVVDQAIFEHVTDDPFEDHNLEQHLINASYDRIKTSGLDFYY